MDTNFDVKSSGKLISDKEQTEYLPFCPAQVQRHIIMEEDGKRTLTIFSCPCTNKPMTLDITVTLWDSRRSLTGELTVTTDCGRSQPIECPDNAVFVHSRIEQVHSGDVLIWDRENQEPVTLPEQEILWQTDPLYGQLRRECEGIVNPVYRPDRPEGLWRCTCGQINLIENPACGKCGVALTWLDEHFDRDYLTEQNRLYEEKWKNLPAKKTIIQKSKADSDRAKMIAIFTGIGAAFLLVILTVSFIIPSIRYSSAMNKLEAGDFDSAIAVFSDLENFRDAKEKAADATYRKAQQMTGLSEVYLTTTAEEPWYSITEDGVLSFRKDYYTGSWENFIVPDIVDGIIVRELDKSFFLNCKEMIYCTLSDCLEVLGEQTFFNCEALTGVDFGANLHTLGPRTFINCYALQKITIPDTVTKIGLRAFNSCINLREITLGNGITAIPSYLFSCCYSLEKVTFRSPITEIDDFAFSECPSMSTITYPGTQAQWQNVIIGEENEILSEVTVNCIG